MYHPRLKGTHYNMGAKLGSMLKKYDVKLPIKLDSFQLQLGKESAKILKLHFPEAAEEIHGLTDLAGYDYEVFSAWMMCMGCCLSPSEKDLPEVRGCTAFAFTHNGNICCGRDNDLPPFLKKGSNSIYYKPQDKLSFILNTSSFINGEEGINEKGLAVGMTFVIPKKEEIKPGLNSVFLVRYILENCKTVEEGIAALKSLPIASSCNIILADNSSNMVVVECNPCEINIRQPEKSVTGENFIVTVNNFTSNEMTRHDGGEINSFQSQTRYKTAYNALKNIPYTDSVEHTKAILSGKHGFMCQYSKGLNFDTIWASVFDITGRRIYLAEGNPARTKFKEDLRFKEFAK